MTSEPIIRADPRSGIFYVHWSEKTPRGERGRSRRVSTKTCDPVQAEKVRKLLSLTGETSAQPKVQCSRCKAFAKLFFELIDDGKLSPAEMIGHKAEPVAAPTIAELWASYLEEHVKRKVASPITLEKSWANLEPHFGQLRFSAASQEVVDRYEKKRQRGAIGRPSQPATIRKELTALRSCFNWCASPKRKILKKEDLPVFDLPPSSEPRDRWLRPNEIEALMKAAAANSRHLDKTGRMGRGERFLILGLETAARSEAIRQLTWDRVDWQTKTIDFNVPGRKRTSKRRSVVPISKALEPVLLRMYGERISDYVLDSDAPVWKSIRRIAKAAGVPDVSPHVLRHTAATLMARRGATLFHISRVLGNTTAMVERIYAKHQPDDLRAAVNKISTSLPVLDSDGSSQ